MRTILSFLLLAPLAGAAPVKGPDDRPSELEGKWVVIVATSRGNVEEIEMVGMVFVIKGGQFTLLKPPPGRQCRVKVDSNTYPKRIEFEVLKPTGKFDEKSRWIYELDGDQLRMASFTNSDGSLPEKIDPTDRKQMVWTLKRVNDR